MRGIKCRIIIGFAYFAYLTFLFHDCGGEQGTVADLLYYIYSVHNYSA